MDQAVANQGSVFLATCCHIIVTLSHIVGQSLASAALLCTVYRVAMSIGVRANVHLGGQTQFCPNDHEQMYCLLPEKFHNICTNWGGGSTAP